MDTLAILPVPQAAVLTPLSTEHLYVPITCTPTTPRTPKALVTGVPHDLSDLREEPAQAKLVYIRRQYRI